MQSSYIGKVIDHYRIIERLGIGGMGVVFKAINIKIDKLVALKMIAPGLAMNKNFVKRFHAEAKALAKLKDFNIVDIVDLRSDNDQFFIVMEYVDGENLYDIIKKDGAYTCDQAIPLLKQILTAIGHAHKAGIIHRDLKPNNIMVTKDGVVKITDFGLAKDQTIEHNTVSIASGGTLYYMSPEHVKGFSFTDHRSDLYSIGMTFYEMITGKVPFQNINSDFDLRERIVRKVFERPSVYNKAIPSELESIIMKAIAKDPAERYQTANEMLSAVEMFEKSKAFQTLSGVSPRPLKSADADPETRFDSPVIKKSNSYFKKFIAALFILLIILASFYYYPDFFRTITNKQHPQKAHADTTRPFPVKDSVRQDVVIPLVKSSPSQPQTSAVKTKKTVAKDFILTLKSTPSVAQVFLNGLPKGTTPLKLKKLKSGTYQLTIRKSGYETYAQTLRWENRAPLSQTAKLEMLPGRLEVDLKPVDAQIQIDGQVASAEELNKLTPGRHLLKIEKNGYRTFHDIIQIQADQSTKIKVDLQHLLGLLSVQVIPWGSIYINDELVKAETDLTYADSLPVAEYDIRVEHPELGTWIKTVQNSESKPTHLIIDFNMTRAVHIEAKDTSGHLLTATIFVDGKNVARQTPSAVSMPVGLHKIDVQLAGYKNQSPGKELMIDQNSNETLLFVLTKK